MQIAFVRVRRKTAPTNFGGRGPYFFKFTRMVCRKTAPTGAWVNWEGDETSIIDD